MAGAIDMDAQRALPVDVIWPGFAVNTLFYSLLAWPLFALLGSIRGRRRIKRGQCPECAYPVGTNEVCTECGAAVVTQKVESA